MSAAPGRLTYHLIRLPDRRYTFDGELLHADEEWIAAASQVTPSKPLIIEGEEVLGDGYFVVWFLFNGQPWDVGRVYRPDGAFTGYYADVLEPVRWDGDDPTTLEPLVDLFLDLWIGADGTVFVLDEDELEEAVMRGSISPEQTSHARRVATELYDEARAGRFPPVQVQSYHRPTSVEAQPR